MNQSPPDRLACPEFIPLSNFLPLFVGRGRLARHLIHHFEIERRPYLHLENARNLLADPELSTKLNQATHVWLLTSDHSLQVLRDQIAALHPGSVFLHSSAATQVAGASTLHPLMTFSHAIYLREVYESIPWVTFDDSPAPAIFEQLIVLPAATRVHYHASCVMISNFSQILWNAAESLSPDVPAKLWHPILKQTLANFMESGSKSLTGPLVRGDTATIQAHQEAMQGMATSKLYTSFVDYFQKGGLSL